MPTKKAAAPPEPTILDIATLAARFLPPVSLPDIGDLKLDHETFRAAVSELTTGRPYTYSKSYEYPKGWATPFEMMAEEAVLRARILFNAAAGKLRPDRIAYLERAKTENAASAELEVARAKMRKAHFARLANGASTIPLAAVLKFALPKVYAHNSQNAWEHFREYLRNSVAQKRLEYGLPAIKVTFFDLATDAEKQVAAHQFSNEGPPACVVLPHDESYQVDEFEFPCIVIDLKNFYKRHGDAIQKRIAREQDRTGAKKKKTRREPPLLTRRDEAKLQASAKNGKRRRRALDTAFRNPNIFCPTEIRRTAKDCPFHCRNPDK